MRLSIKSNHRRAAIKRLNYFLYHNGINPFNKGMKLKKRIILFADHKGVNIPKKEKPIDWLISLYLSGHDNDCAQGVLKSLKKERLKKRDSYHKYLNSAGWKQFRQEALCFYNNECGVCGSHQYLDVHHKHYKTIFKEQLSDVMILCRGCHQKEHKRKF